MRSLAVGLIIGALLLVAPVALLVLILLWLLQPRPAPTRQNPTTTDSIGGPAPDNVVPFRPR